MTVTEYKIGTEADLIEWHGGRVKPDASVVMTCTVEGVVTGVGGVAWVDGIAVAYLECPLRYMPSAVTATRLARRVLSAVFEAGETAIYANADPQYPRARKWLAMLGFQHHSFDDSGAEVLICRP